MSFREAAISAPALRDLHEERSLLLFFNISMHAHFRYRIGDGLDHTDIIIWSEY